MKRFVIDSNCIAGFFWVAKTAEAFELVFKSEQTITGYNRLTICGQVHAACAVLELLWVVR